MKPPTTYVTIYDVADVPDGPVHYALDEDGYLRATEGEPPDWEVAGYCDSPEHPETAEATKDLLLALKDERVFLGDTGYTAHDLWFSLNEHDVLEIWVEATNPQPGEYVLGSEYNPVGLAVSDPLRVVVHEDLYITRGR